MLPLLLSQLKMQAFLQSRFSFQQEPTLSFTVQVTIWTKTLKERSQTWPVLPFRQAENLRLQWCQSVLESAPLMMNHHAESAPTESLAQYWKLWMRLWQIALTFHFISPLAWVMHVLMTTTSAAAVATCKQEPLVLEKKLSSGMLLLGNTVFQETGSVIVAVTSSWKVSVVELNKFLPKTLVLEMIKLTIFCGNAVQIWRHHQLEHMMASRRRTLLSVKFAAGCKPTKKTFIQRK